MVRVLEQAGCIHTAFWRYVGLVYLRTVGVLRPQMMLSVWLHSSDVPIDSQAMLELREIDRGPVDEALDEALWDRIGELAWTQASLARWNQLVTVPERALLAKQWSPRAGRSPVVDGQFTRAPLLEEWAVQHVHLRTSEWLQKRAVLRWLPSADPWLPQLLAAPARPLWVWEEVVLQSQSSNPPPWSEVLDAVLETDGWEVRDATDAWKAAVEVLQRFRQRMEWPESMMTIPEWTVVEAEWVLQAVLWLPIFARGSASPRRLQALARLYVSLCFHEACRGWYVRRDNPDHNRLVLAWMQKQFPTLWKKKTGDGLLRTSLAANVPSSLSKASADVDYENAEAEIASQERWRWKRRRLHDGGELEEGDDPERVDRESRYQ